MTANLNNPYYMYPGFPFSGYHERDIYNHHLINLNNYIKELINNISNKVLLHITIGAAGEEAHVDYNKNIGYQWQQLFPEHLMKFIKENPYVPVYNIIIAPNKFLNNNYKPLFIKNTNKLHWYSDKSNMYQTENFTVQMFCCPMPSECNYSSLINRLRTHNIMDENYYKSIEQTQNDKDFIKKFYNNLEILFDKINYYNGLVSCFSFAVFNAETIKAQYNNFTMFKEITKLFPKLNNQRILAEWVYILNYYYVHVFRQNKKICYIKNKYIKDKEISKLLILDNIFIIKKYRRLLNISNNKV
jgi:hypothetical protein